MENANAEEAKEVMEKLKEQMEIIRGKKVKNIDKIEKIYSTILNFYEKNAYEKVASEGRKLLEVIEKALAKEKKEKEMSELEKSAREKFEECRKKFEEMRAKALASAEIENMLRQVEKSIENKQWEEALSLAEKLLRTGSVLVEEFEKANNFMNDITKLVEESEALKRAFESEIEGLKSIISAGEYRAAIELATNLIERIRRAENYITALRNEEKKIEATAELYYERREEPPRLELRKKISILSESGHFEESLALASAYAYMLQSYLTEGQRCLEEFNNIFATENFLENALAYYKTNLSYLKAKIEEGKEIGVSSEDAEHLLAEAEKFWEEKKYGEAFDNILLAKSYIYSAIENKILEKLTNIEQFISTDSGIQAENLERLKAKLEEAKEFVRRKEYRGANSIIGEIKEEFLREREAAIAEMRNLIEREVAEAESYGVEVPGVKRLVSIAERALVKEDYAEAVKHFKNAIEGFNAAITVEVEKRITDAERFRDYFKELAQSRFVAKLEEIKGKSSLKPMEALREVITAQNLFVEEFNALIRARLEKISEIAKKLGIDIQMAEIVCTGYEDAVYAHKKLENFINETNSKFKIAFEKLVEEGKRKLELALPEMPLANEKELFMEFLKCIEDGAWERALQLYNEFNNSLEKSVSDFVKNFVKEKLRLLNATAKEFGLEGLPAKEIGALLKNLSLENAKEVYSKALALKEDLEKGITRFIEEKIGKIRQSMEIGVSIGLNIQDVKEKMEVINNLLAEKRFVEANSNLEEIRKVMASSLVDFVEKEIKGARELLSLAEEMKIDVSDVNAQLIDAENLLKRKNVIRAHEKVSEAREKLEKIFEEAAKEKESLLEIWLSIMEKVGLKPSELIEQSKTLKTLSQERKVFEETKLANKLLEDSMQLLASQLLTLFKYAEERIETLEKLALADGMRERLERARILANTNRTQEALREITQLIGEIEKTIKEKSLLMLERLTYLLETSKQYGIEPPFDPSLLENIRRSIEENRHLDALLLAFPIYQNYYANYTKLFENYLSQMLSGIHENLKTLSSLGISTMPYAESLDNCQKYMAEKDWRNAFELANAIRTDTQNAIRRKIEEGLADIDEKMQLLERRGEDVSKLKFIKEVAMEKLKSGELSKAVSAVLSAKESLDKMLTEKLTGLLDYWRRMLEALERYGAEPVMGEKVAMLEERLKTKPISALEIDEELRRMLKEKIEAKSRENIERLEQIKSTFLAIKMDWDKIENSLRTLSAKENFEVLDIQNMMGFIDNINAEIKVRTAKLLVEFENQLSLLEEGKREEVRGILKRAKDLLEASQLTDANLEIKKVTDVLRSAIEKKIQELMSDAERIIGFHRALNLNFHLYENRYLDAKERLAKEEYTQVIHILEELIAQGEKEIKDYIAHVEREIGEAIETLKKLEIDASEINKKFEKLKEFEEKEDFESWSSVYNNLKEMLTKTTEENLIAWINQADLLIEFALGLGIDVSHAKELLNKGKIRFASKMYVQTKNLITKAMATTEESLRNYISNEITSLMSEIEMLSMLGMPIEDYNNQAEDARRKLEAKDYVGAHSSTVKIKKEVEERLEENSAKMLNEIKACIEVGAQIGIESALFERMYLTAQTFINAKNYEALVSLAKDAKSKFSEMVHQIIKTHNETFGKWLDILALHEISVENYVDIRNMAKNTLEAGNAVEAAKILKNALNDMELTVKDKIVKTMDEIQTKMNFLRKFGVDVSKVEFGLKNISAKLEAKDYIEARKHIEGTQKELKVLGEIKARDLLSSLRVRIGKLKEFGVSVVDRTSEIEVLISAGKYFEAINGYEAILEEVNQVFANHILKILEEVEVYLNSCTHILPTTSNFFETLKQARALVENKAYDEAYPIASELRTHVSTQIEGKINEKIREAKDYLERFKAIGPDILSAAIIVNNATLLLSQKKYPEAYALANEAIEKIIEGVREHTAKEIEDYKTFIADCERIGIDVTKFREGVENAEKLLKENKVFETYYSIKETKKFGEESMATYLSARINDTMAKIEEAEHLGVDLAKVINLKNRLASAKSSQNVLDALRELKSIEEDAVSASEEKVREVYNSINELYTYFSNEAPGVKETEALLASASASINSKNLFDAMAALIDAETIISENVERQISTELEKWKKFVTFLMKLLPEFSSVIEQIKKVSDLVVMKDYRKAYAMLSEVRKGVESTANEKLLPVFDEKISEVEELKNVGVEVSKVEILLKEAKEGLARGDYLLAEERFEEGLAQLERILSAYSSTEIGMFTNNIELARKLGFDVSKYEKALSEIKSKISNGKYRDAIFQLIDCQKELYARLKGLIEKEIGKCIEEMEIVGELNIDFSEVNALLESAKMRLKYMDMGSAYDIVKKALEILPEIVRGQIAKEIESQIERGRRLKEKGIDISKHEALLHRAMERLEAGKYSEAKFLIVRYLNAILPILEENFDKSIEDLRATLNTAKAIGLKVEGEEKLWNEIKGFVRVGDYIKANELIESFQSNLIARIESTVSAQLQIFATLLEIANAQNSRIPGTQESYALAQQEFQNKRYISALQIAKQNITKLEEVLREKASYELKSIEDEIADYKKYALDTSVPERIVEEAKKRLEEKNYSHAFQSITQARNYLTQNATEFEKKLIEDCQRLINAAVEMKINTDEENVIFSNGKALFNGGKLQSALSQLVLAKEKITQKIKSELKARLETMNSTLEFAKSIKIDTSEIEYNLQNAQKALLINNFEDAHRYIASATAKFMSGAGTALGGEISKIEGLVSLGESLGCNLTQQRREIIKVKEMVVNKEFIRAKKQIDEIAERCKSALIARVMEEIESGKATIELAKKFGIEVARQAEVLSNAEKLVRNEQYQEAYNHAIETKAYIVNSIVKFLNGEISSANALLNESLSIGVPELSFAKENLDGCVKKLHEMDFENAYRMVNAAREHIIRNASEYLHALIKDVENILGEAKSIEAIVPDELYSELENAKAYISQHRFRDAKDIAMKVFERGASIANAKVQERMNLLNSLLEQTRALAIPVENANEEIKAITQMLGEKNFKGANKKCLEFSKRVSELLQNYCEAQIINTAKLVDLAESLGIKMIEIKRSVERTWEFLKNKQYMEVVKLTNDVQNQIYEIVDRFLTDEMQKIQNEIRYAESIGANAARVKEILTNAQTKQREKDYIGAHRALKDCKDALERVLVRHINDSMSVARLTFDIGMRVGVDLSDIKEKFKDVETLNAEKKFKEAYTLVVETRKNIIKRIEDFMESVTNDVKQKIETALELGVDVSNARAMFEIAQSTLRSKDYLEARKILLKIDEDVENLCRNALLQEYERLLKSVEEFKGKNVDLSEVVSALERAKSRIDRKLYVEAKLALETVNTKIRTIERIVKLGV